MHLPRMRTLWRATLLTLKVLLVILLASALAARLVGRQRLAEAKTAFSRVYGPTDPAAWETIADEDRENAARLIQAAALLLQLRQAEPELIRRATKAGARGWSESQRRELAQLLERNRASLDLAHRAAELRYSSYGFRCDYNTPLPPLLKLRHLGMLLAVEAQLARESHEDQAAVRALQAELRIASSLTEEGPLVVYLLGVAIEGSAMSVAAEWAQEEPRAGDAVAFLDQIDATLPTTSLLADWRRAVGVETVTMLKMRMLDIAAAPTPQRPLQERLSAALLWPVEDLNSAEVLKVALRFAALASGKTLRERLPEPSPPPSPWRVLPDKILAAIIEPSFERTLVTVTEAVARRQLVHAALQVRGLGLQTGACPASRPDLPALRTPEPLTGRPLVYAPQPDGSLVIAFDEAALPEGIGLAFPTRLTLSPCSGGPPRSRSR